MALKKWQSDGPSWSVATGRRDGRVSLSSQASNLPSPLDPISVQRKKFSDKGLDHHDLVTLLGELFHIIITLLYLSFIIMLILNDRKQ